MDCTVYARLSAQLLGQIRASQPVRAAVVPAYRNKDSFGDIDVVVDDGFDFAAFQTAHPQYRAVRNGRVLSLLIDGQYQADLIRAEPECFAVTLDYLSYNDLGNLIGRIAHRLGYKYGLHGLSILLREGDHQFGEVLVSRDPDRIRDFLGLPPRPDFEDLTQIFAYVAQARHFHSGIYPFAALNNKNRVRDRKRQTYHAFLQWLHTRPASTGEPVQWSPEQALDAATAYFGPHVQAQYQQLRAQQALQQARRSQFNGDLVGQWTGLSGQALGALIRAYRQSGQFDPDAPLAVQQARLLAFWQADGQE